MKKLITEFVTAIEPELVQVRRDFHKHAEVGWTEFRTTAILAKKLIALGYEVEIGEKVIKKEAMMGVPKTRHPAKASGTGYCARRRSRTRGANGWGNDGTGRYAALRRGSGCCFAL